MSTQQESKPFAWWQPLFGLLPLCIACLLAFHAISLEEEFRKNRAFKHLDEKLNSIVKQSTIEEYLSNRFTRFKNLLFKGGFSFARFEKSLAQARKIWKFPFDVYVFDSSGKMVNSGSTAGRAGRPAKTSPSGRLAGTPPSLDDRKLQKVWDILRSTPSAGKNDSIKYKKVFSFLFGLDFHFEKVAKLRRKIFTIRSNNSDGVCFWDTDGKPGYGGIFIAVWKQPSQIHLLRKIIHRDPSSIFLATTDTSGNVKFLKRPPDPEVVRTQIFNHFTLTREKAWVEDSRLWTTAPAGNLNVICGETRENISLNLSRRRVIFLFLFLAPLIILAFHSRFITSRTMFFSIRTKLVFLFIFAIAIPLMELAFLGFQTLRDRREVLISETYKEGRNLLSALEAEFGKETGRCLALFQNFRDDPNMRMNVKAVEERARKLRKARKLGRFEARNISGEIVALSENNTMFDQIKGMFDGFAVLSIERNLGDRLVDRPEKPIDQSEMVMRMIIESPEMGFLYLIDRPNRIHEVKFGTYHTYFFWDMYKEKNHPLAYVTLAQMVSSVFDEFLKDRIGYSGELNSQGFKLIARNNGSNRWYPSTVHPDRTVVDLMDRLKVGNQTLTDRIVWNGIPYLVVGMSGLNLEGHSLLALRREDAAFKTLSAIRNFIFLGMFLALMIAVLTGAVLGDTFLTPIGELFKGIQALRDRDTFYRIPAPQKDEFGDLSLAFNKMIGGLKEMELAKVVQEALIPNTMPDVKGYKFDLFIQTASDLGGDYCDILVMNDGRLLLLIGDVTGHGVSSALLVAMAKTVVYQFAQEGGSVSQLLTKLNFLIFNLLKKRKLMTFFAGVLDPETGMLTYSNAGHPFPLICSKSGEVKFVEMARYPLGASMRKGNFEEICRQISPGDSLLLYTDGLIEAMDKNGRMFGYTQTQKALAEYREKDPQEVRKLILKEFFNHQGGGELDDDITLLLLKREN